MAQKPSIPKGTRDFTPEEIAKRSYITEVIKKHFTLFGFLPIETPSFENSETLLGKYGEDGDRLIFKILNSGDFLNKLKEEIYQSRRSESFATFISEKALRYDLTVPFARYVVMHQHEINFPFKRYQMQPVWRADRPQMGRYREFYQCDADVVGAYSLLQEVEFIQLYDAVFDELKLKGVTIKLNNRKVLSGIAGMIGAQEHLIAFTVALDKLDKIGVEGVKDEMRNKGISQEAIDRSAPLFDLNGSNQEQLKHLAELLKGSPIGSEGVAELAYVCDVLEDVGLKSADCKIDVTLARGLNYYTGSIFEVSAPQAVTMGSIGGGGRYDDLTGNFGLKGVSGVGISFGLDRMYLVLEELGLFPERLQQTLKVLCVNFGGKAAIASLKMVTTLRNAGIPADLYPGDVKLQKQFKYADQRNIPYVISIGDKELTEGNFLVKNMKNGEESVYKIKMPEAFLSQL